MSTRSTTGLVRVIEVKNVPLPPSLPVVAIVVQISILNLHLQLIYNGEFFKYVFVYTISLSER